MNKRILFLVLAVIVIVVILIWAFIVSSKPLPGEEALQDGRNHIVEGTPIDYKFNPPTSGDHYPSWITKGVYDEPRPDGNLVHSQEHGYIIFWYNCERKLTSDKGQMIGLIPEALAQGIQMTQGSEGSPSAKLSDMPKAFSDGSCDSFKSRLKDLYIQFGQHKLIVIPRVGIDHPLILTAWGRVEKLDSLDKGKVQEFIDAFRDHGPEQTIEP